MCAHTKQTRAYVLEWSSICARSPFSAGFELDKASKIEKTREMAPNSTYDDASRIENADPKIESSCNYANFSTDIIGSTYFRHLWCTFTNGRFIVEFKYSPGIVIVFDTFYQAQMYVGLINYSLAVF